MAYASNTNGYPIYGIADPVTGIQPRLLVDPANAAQVVDEAENVIPLLADGSGNPADGTGAAIPQPLVSYLIQIMLDDGIQRRFNHGALVNPVRVVGPRVAHFGRTPARIDTNPLDYTTKEHLQLYKDASKSLYRDGETSFDLSKGRLHGFLGKVGQRAQVSGWSFNIVTDATAGTTKSLLTGYDEIMVDNVRA